MQNPNSIKFQDVANGLLRERPTKTKLKYLQRRTESNEREREFPFEWQKALVRPADMQKRTDCLKEDRKGRNLTNSVCIPTRSFRASRFSPQAPAQDLSFGIVRGRFF